MKLAATLLMFAFVVLLFIVSRMIIQIMQLRAFANLATISADSLVVRLHCTGRDPSSQQAAFRALKRHARTRGACDDDQISFDCWRRMFGGDSWIRTFNDLRELQSWCK